MKTDLQGRYVKEYLQTFYVLPFSSPSEHAYKLRMLENNRHEAILPVEAVSDGIDNIYRYAVGGMKAMDLVFRTLPIDLDRLLTILKSFVAVFEEVFELLLDPDDLVLEPECVFINITDYKAGFIYLPGYGKGVSKQAEGFFEYMLNRVDYDDKKAVTLLYDCYILMMKEEKGIEALKERIVKETPAPARAINNEKIFTEPVTRPRVLQSPSPETSLRSWLGGRFKKKKEPEKCPMVSEAETGFDEDPGETVLLSVRRQEWSPCLVNTENEEKTVIDKLPFVIGSLSGHTDLAPKGRNVSRLHAEIRKTEKGLAIVDLNSTNGSKLNGETLIPGEVYGLCTNDRIGIADLEFIYKDGVHTPVTV